MPPALSDSTMAPGPSPSWNSLIIASRAPAREAAVVAADRLPGDLGEVVGEPHAPGGELGEDEDPLAGGEDLLDDLLEAVELPGPTGQRLVVLLVVPRVVADLLERGDGGEDRALLHVALGALGLHDEAVEHGLVEADLLGRHRAVVELVDAVGQLGGHARLGLGAAEHEDAVEGPQRLLALAGQLADERGATRRRGRGW